MLTLYNAEKIHQTLPGQGWRVILATEDVDCVDELIVFEEPVIAWVTFDQPHQEGHHEWEWLHVSALIRNPQGSDLSLCNSPYKGYVYLSPGEERTAKHDALALERAGAK